MKNIFKDFTNQYELSKTLRFELKPIGNTQKMLEENGVFKKDKEIAENYKEAKIWFDKLHREFIDKTLKKTKIDIKLLQEYERAYKNKKTKTGWSILDKISKKLRTNIVKSFESMAKEWQNNYTKNITDKNIQKRVRKLKKLELFFKVEVFKFLKQKYPEAQINEKSIFDSFNKFSTYFTGFHQTRNNFYKDDGTSTAVPTRIINENLPKFLENKKIYENKYLNKYSELFSDKEREIFSLKYFNQCFTQGQIEEYNDIVSGLKTKINKYRQKYSNKKSDDYISRNELPYFKILFKQILGEKTKRETEQNFIEIATDDEVFDVLKDFVDENERQLPKAKELFLKFIKSQKTENNEFDISKIYVAGRFINTISNKWFADWNTILNLFINNGKSKKLPEFISLQTLKNKLQSVKIKKEEFFNNNKEYKDIYKKSDDYYQIFLRIWEQEFNKKIEIYNAELKVLQKMIENDKKFTNKKGKLRNDEKGEIQKEIIKCYADSTLSIYQIMKYFSLEKGKGRNWNPDGLEEDTEFYNDFSEYYKNTETWKYFNEFRNYLTKKPYSEDKIKLNFENGTLLDGWDKNKEKDNFGVIFLRNGKYYLGLIHKDNNQIFDEKNKNEIQNKSKNGGYKKMMYKFLPDPKKMLPKVCFSKKGIEFFKPLLGIIRIKENESFKKNENNFSLNNLHKIIDYYKNCLIKYEDWKVFDFANIKPTKQYQDNIGEFYKDIEKNAYKIWFEDVSDKYINKKIENGELYLFEIYNKDFAQKANGKKNLHTLYWEEIFSKKNRENPMFKLNGKAEIFFRKRTENFNKEEIKTKEKQIILDKNNHKGEKAYKYKRYTQDKILFHCPITLNFTKEKVGERSKKSHIRSFNSCLRVYLANNPDINIIGIDRGEKHLAYYSIISQRGDILEIDSLNIINGTDYHKILDNLEKERDAQRKSWQSIVKIKDMKRGYVSQAVKKICDLMIKYNAIVVFENLNIGFKRGRFAIEKQIYQNLELALAKKLNYFVLKDAKENENGHHAKAYQLTPKVDNFQDIRNQCGMMFYIPASYTSAICPVCGFRKNISTPINTKNKNKELIEKFKISYEADKRRFQFEYQRDNIVKIENNKKEIKKFKLFTNKKMPNNFIFYSDVERFQYLKKDKKTHLRNPNKELLEVFVKNNINIDGDIEKQIKEGDFDNKNFYKPLIYNIRLILQLRNSIVKKDKKGNIIEKESHDFIQCPSCHFHSEKDFKGLDKKYKGKDKLKFNGDANGAYNIARKGGLVLQKITRFEKEFKDLSLMQNQDLIITQEEWDKFAQNTK